MKVQILNYNFVKLKKLLIDFGNATLDASSTASRLGFLFGISDAKIAIKIKVHILKKTFFFKNLNAKVVKIQEFNCSFPFILFKTSCIFK